MEFSTSWHMSLTSFFFLFVFLSQDKVEKFDAKTKKQNETKNQPCFTSPPRAAGHAMFNYMFYLLSCSWAKRSFGMLVPTIWFAHTPPIPGPPGLYR